MGVIDILTAWTLPKALENLVKTIAHPHDPMAVSCVPPHKYANRFERTMGKWIADTTPVEAKKV